MRPVRPSPPQVLQAQVERARAAGHDAMFGSELEFDLLRESYAEPHAKHYRDLTPSVPYILDYHILATTYDEPLLRQIRNGMQGAGVVVENSKGEAIAYLNGCSTERFPSRLHEAIRTLEEGTVARAAFGDDVVDRYLNYARTEQRLFDEAVTCCERERLYERG
jgi:glutamine synthetase